MRRPLFALWLAASAVALYVVGWWVHPPVAHFGSPSSLAIAAVWLVGVVPLSFALYFRAERAREQQVVEVALQSWRAGAAGAGALVAQALELALAEEDEASLRRLLDTLSRTAPAPLEAALQPFLDAANAWLSDDGGHSSRDEHLERLKQAALPLLPRLSEGSPPR